jgi:hypothetical protein
VALLRRRRYSLATFLSNGAKIQPKTVQGLLRHADIKTTLGLYTQDDSDEKQAAQGAFLDAMELASSMVQQELWNGLWIVTVGAIQA